MTSGISYFSSLRFKLVGVALIIEIVMLSVLIWNSLRLIEDNLVEQLEHRVQQLQPLLNASLAGPLLQQDMATLNEIIRQIATTEINYVALYNTYNELAIESGKPPENIPSTLASYPSNGFKLTDNHAELHMPIELSGRKIGRLFLELDTSFIHQASNAIRTQSGIIAAIEIFLGFLLLGLTGYYLTQHLQALTLAAQKMGEGDLNARVQIDSRDEVGVAARTLNIMAEQIFENQSSLLNREKEIVQLNDSLEKRVEQRTAELEQTNSVLQISLGRLKQAQEKLIEADKMAALGGLVAGISHEINTPIGVSVTATSHLNDKIKKYLEKYNDESLTRKDFEDFLKISGNASDLILKNLNRASELIKSFKQVAVDQSHDEIRRFNVKEYLTDTLLSLQPELRNLEPVIQIDCDEQLEMELKPGALAQIITNLVMNSLIHGFEDMNKHEGRIELSIHASQKEVIFRYQDNGIGMEKDDSKKVFEPFYTTKRNTGGSGLGMHITYNLVRQTLGGDISLHSTPGEGTIVEITIPV